MSLRIGILGNEGSWYVAQLCHAAQTRGHTAIELRFNQLQMRLSTGHSEPLFEDIAGSSLDAIIVRTMPPGSLEQVVCRMDFLAAVENCGVRVVNSPKSMECAIDKYLTTQKLVDAGLPVPPTIVCETAEAAMEAFELLGGNVVAKPLFGSEGRGILHVDHPELALRTFRTLERLNAVLYLQAFNRGPSSDIRILLLDGHVLAAMQRTPRDGDFRANTAQRGTSVPWNPTREEQDLARRAAEVTGCIFSGVDLMYNERGEPMVVEVNAVPGWRNIQKTCQLSVPEKLFQWLEATTI